MDIFLLCTFGTAGKQQDDLGPALRVIETSASAEVNAQLNYAIANRLEVAQQAEGKTLDSFRDRAAYPRVFQSIKPCGELGKRPDGKHGQSVIDRLQKVKQNPHLNTASFRSDERLKTCLGLANAGQAEVAAEDGHGFKKRGGVFASADGDADGLEGLPGLQA